MGRNIHLKNWRYYRDTWKPQRLRNRGPPVARIQQLEQALDRLDKLRHGSCSHLLLYASLLRQCGNQGALHLGQRVHSHIIENGLISNAFLGELIFQMYARCRCLDSALALFNAMPSRRISIWNILIEAYRDSDHPQEAIHLYQRMSRENVQPNEGTFVGVLEACARLRHLREGQLVHYRVATGYPQCSTQVHAAVIRMYSLCSRMDLAEMAFDAVPETDLLVWNRLIAGYHLNGEHLTAVELYRSMREQEIQPDAFTLSRVLWSCSEAGDLETGKMIHGFVKENEIRQTVVHDALVKLYAKLGKFEEAKGVFEEMPVWDSRTWTTMIGEHARLGHNHEAVALYREMDARGLAPSRWTFIAIAGAIRGIGGEAGSGLGSELHSRVMATGIEQDGEMVEALIRMYFGCGSEREAEEVLDSTAKEHRTAGVYEVMICGYAQAGHHEKILQLFSQMLKLNRVIPSEPTYSIVLQACTSTGNIAAAAWVRHKVKPSEDLKAQNPRDEYSTALALL